MDNLILTNILLLVIVIILFLALFDRIVEDLRAKLVLLGLWIIMLGIGLSLLWLTIEAALLLTEYGGEDTLRILIERYDSRALAVMHSGLLAFIPVYAFIVSVVYLIEKLNK